MKEYIKKSKGIQIASATNNIGYVRPDRKTLDTRKEKCEEKQLNRHLKWHTIIIVPNITWAWLRKGNLKNKQRYKNQLYQNEKR